MDTGAMWQPNTRKAENDVRERQAEAARAESVATADDDLRWARRLDEHEHPPERPARPLVRIVALSLVLLLIATTVLLGVL